MLLLILKKKLLKRSSEDRKNIIGIKLIFFIGEYTIRY